jgi:hypothetical protein
MEAYQEIIVNRQRKQRGGPRHLTLAEAPCSCGPERRRDPEPDRAGECQTVVTGTRPGASSVQVLYQSLLGVASGFSLGGIAWIAATEAVFPHPPLWPFVTAGVVVGVIVVRMASARGQKWVHALWIPVFAFVFWMTAWFLALRNFGS